MIKSIFNKYKKISVLFTLLVISSCGDSSNDEPETYDGKSVARLWNEVLLEAIRNDLARPTVHARNLFHMSAAMYDAWALISGAGSTYLAGKSIDDFSCDLGASDDVNRIKATNANYSMALSHVAYRIISHRFQFSPGRDETMALAGELLEKLNVELEEGTDFVAGSAISSSKFGNRIAECYIAYGLEDGSKEAFFYRNAFYQPINPALEPDLPGNPGIVDINRWQSLNLGIYIDQSGNLVDGPIEFIGAEWGDVRPFALNDADKAFYTRDDYTYSVFLDPGEPPMHGSESDSLFKWSFSLVSKWSSHLDPNDNTVIDISPGAIGNVQVDEYPISFSGHESFYLESGGDIGSGHDLNPVTQEPYESHMVPRADYARVLAEFWADGPDSETPPGHWFVIMNSVTDHDLFERRFAGSGGELGPLEWDLKAYFSLGAAMHDSAIAAWSAKGRYDYVRPVSALRAMADLGQSSDPELPSFNSGGLPLSDGYIELVESGDTLAGTNDENVGKIKLYAWRGPDFISDPSTDSAGVGWILAENWWPYQRPSFVTPPFAGYVSGHSTYSRAAAEVLTALTGSEYFPGGIGRFEVNANEFLVFEEGPTVDFELQWATYRDAADQCSLSRIWGGIHPTIDDIPGRFIGEVVGTRAFAQAALLFSE